MKIVEIKDRNSVLIERLVNVWEDSLRMTHLFLSDPEIENIKKYVPQALYDVSNLIILKDEKGNIQAFMGIEGQKLDMLFVSSKEQNKGFGKKLICYGINNYSINEVCVNEQNPIAKRFYEYMGFRVYKRSDIDEQSNPYPILYMRLA
ncbi:GNAT family N-acetyltransferase [Campylobacter fetus]|uniref:GNAT family N-acetyltransferase n=1 Tax=Campylobacter fetus TaxID=196 RepID=UPI000509198A|nr:GNAT family N-acetyltransferase [Campylobacter fetus]WKW16887.1 GNAT family N-acetyltransferase [Campylobacter fetus subsp. fetus]AIR79117.1 putative acetyltransferase [Campylobacter fetus subsp. fetus 04/554]EAJ5692655.1 GNAT family N-acetyltransferase [Campylobacter fetus]EAJ5704134.1 GNAT family N-acetyltransferase [Campylobacter fetus]EAJ9257233.1 GNAT family N-acetyltransferase [Campylobacter fetus]